MLVYSTSSVYELAGVWLRRFWRRFHISKITNGSEVFQTVIARRGAGDPPGFDDGAGIPSPLSSMLVVTMALLDQRRP